MNQKSETRLTATVPVNYKKYTKGSQYLQTIKYHLCSDPAVKWLPYKTAQSYEILPSRKIPQMHYKHESKFMYFQKRAS